MRLEDELDLAIGHPYPAANPALLDPADQHFLADPFPGLPVADAFAGQLLLELGQAEAVLAGDVGHGLMLLLPALLLCLFERRFKGKDLGEIFGMMFRARYLLVLMSACAIYTGFLYNEFYAIPMNVGSSKWSPAPPSQYMVKNSEATFAFGVDPAWKTGSNELQFYNSLKMKISVILAYFHMMLGIVMHAFNAVHFRRPYDLYFEFV